jgi:hypothetical protein
MLTDLISAALFTTRVPANGCIPQTSRHSRYAPRTYCLDGNLDTSIVVSLWQFFSRSNKSLSISSMRNNDEPTLFFLPLAPQEVCDMAFSS